ncbi:FecR domain-containing protein [Roseomonas sp. 18066]|uniref:FecR family protein n=1 Tax=Roseomonas sp. 18066 TaxID=2681412 RepID=UPI001359F00F|nr:FecR domain-containing protein [Roseomonas sp. 18066]
MRDGVRGQAVDWAIRLHDGALGAAEARALDRWLAEDPAHAVALRQARQLLGDADAALVSDPAFTKRLLRRRGRVRLPVFCALLLLAAGGAAGWRDALTWLRADRVSAAAEMPVVVLSDGSRVQLNGRSAIAEDFSAQSRRVVLLRGEAFFQVAADPARPFVVEAGGGSVTVTGTAFDVNLLEEGVAVAVVEHEVAVRGRAEGLAVPVREGQGVFYDGAGALGPVVALSPDMAAPWRQGRLIFEEQRLASVAAQIFRHLPGRVVIASEAVAGRRISGSFDLARPEEALASFAKVFGLRLLRAGDVLTVIY